MVEAVAVEEKESGGDLETVSGGLPLVEQHFYHRGVLEIPAQGEDDFQRALGRKVEVDGRENVGVAEAEEDVQLPNPLDTAEAAFLHGEGLDGSQPAVGPAAEVDFAVGALA